MAAWLDLNTAFGTVRNDLDAAAVRSPGEDAVDVRARTAFGDISVHRASRLAVTPTRRRQPVGTNQRAQIVMSDDEIAEFIEQHRTCTMATVGPDGTPHLVAMWYA